MTNNKIIRTPATQQIPTIMAELQKAADVLKTLGWGVSIFGSARIPPESQWYQLAQQLGTRLAKAGLPVIAGGGPGIMEGANKGAYEAGGTSVGLNIRLPHEKGDNPYQTHSLTFDYFYSRKATFFMHSAAYVSLPGGWGTLDEVFEVMTLVQTGKVPPAPIILVGTDFWSGLLDWIKEQQLGHGMIGSNDMELLTPTDDLDEILTLIIDCCARAAAQTEMEPALPGS